MGHMAGGQLLPRACCMVGRQWLGALGAVPAYSCGAARLAQPGPPQLPSRTQPGPPWARTTHLVCPRVSLCCYLIDRGRVQLRV